VETKDTASAHGPKSITRNILQDLNGHYWLATWEGLIRYNGKQYTNFTLKAGLKKYHVFAIAEQRNGTLWFGMIGGGVYRYDGQSL
jgi:ligand-binding sensor domain-containing protein